MSIESDPWDEFVGKVTEGLLPWQADAVADAIASQREAGMTPDRETLDAVAAVVKGFGAQRATGERAP